MVNGNLPDGWRKATIGDVATSMKNGIYKPIEYYADNGIACLRMYNIEEGVIVWKNIKRMILTDDEIDTYRLLPGDILVNRVNSRELVGKAAIIPERIETTVYESKNIRLRINNDIADSKFINFCFGAFGQQYFNYNAQQVVGMASINQNQIAQMPIPLPPLPEQERIVAKIEELFTQLEAGTAALAKVRAGLRRYMASVLKAAVEGKLGIQKDEFRIGEGELPVGWRWGTVGDVAESMKNGIYKAAEFYSYDGIACLRMYNIDEGNIVWKDIKRMILTDEEMETYRLLPGDILVNRVNSRELVGKAAVIPEGIEPTIYESKNIRLKIKKDVADSKFVNYCFGAYRQQYFNYNAQQVVGMASINQTQINQMPIPLPPLEEQRRIVAEVERRLSVARQVEKAVEKVLARASRLRQAVLKSAFEGRF